MLLGEGNLDAAEHWGGRWDYGDCDGDGLGVGQGDGVSVGVCGGDSGGDVGHAIRYGGDDTCGGVEGGNCADGVVRGECGVWDGACEDVSELVEADDGCGGCLTYGCESDGAGSGHVFSFVVELDFDSVEGWFRFEDGKDCLFEVLVSGEAGFSAEMV